MPSPAVPSRPSSLGHRDTQARPRLGEVRGRRFPGPPLLPAAPGHTSHQNVEVTGPRWVPSLGTAPVLLWGTGRATRPKTPLHPATPSPGTPQTQTLLPELPARSACLANRRSTRTGGLRLTWWGGSGKEGPEVQKGGAVWPDLVQRSGLLGQDPPELQWRLRSGPRDGTDAGGNPGPRGTFPGVCPGQPASALG